MDINGVAIHVEQLKGNGNQNFVLVHNAGSDHRFFTHQLDTLRRFGNVIQFDLPGSGKSSPMASYKMSDLSTVVATICRRLSLTNICLIGLNNGANISIDTALNHSLPIHRMVLIDPPIFMENYFIREIEAYIQSLENATFDERYVASFVDALFIHTDPATKEIAASAFNGMNKKALQGIFKGLLEWDAGSTGILAKISCPTLCILTDEHHCSYAKMRREAPQFEIGKVMGSKCWATLEVPEQVNAMIRRFLHVQESRAGGCVPPRGLV